MRRSHPFLAKSLVLSAFLLFAAHSGAQDLRQKVDEYLEAQQKVNRFSGSILIAKEGRVLAGRGIGMANREWSIPNGPETKFRLGSITKQFTATAILQLEEKGKLKVQDPICRYLAECPPAWQAVTIHHLLTHTSGIPSYTGMPDYRERMMIPTSLEEMVSRFRNEALEFAPGDSYKYNNSGYFLLGMIIEKVSGRSYEEYLKENIFDPLGMKDSGYDRSEHILDRRASGYAPAGQGVVNAPYLDMAQPYAAGSLYSTVEDLHRWDQALYTTKILTEESMKAMFTPFKNNYAYGWGVREQFGRRNISHGGGINGFSTYISRFPSERVVVIVLSNYQVSPASCVATDLAAMVFGESYSLPRERIEITLDPGILDRYVGRYQLGPEVTITITREGSGLMAQLTGQPKIQIFPESETNFFMRMVQAQLRFVKGEDGRVTEAILEQGGASQTAKRIP